jgi:hypothetical protein
MGNLLGGLLLAVKQVKKVVRSRKFQKNFKRGFLFSMTLMVLLLIRNKSAYALDQQPLVIEKRRTWRDMVFKKRYAVSAVGLTAGVVTAGVSGVIIYNLYNNNTVLKTTVNGMTTTINQLIKNADFLQLTVHRKTEVINYLVEGLLTLEKTATNLENRLSIAESIVEKTRVFI